MASLFAFFPFLMPGTSINSVSPTSFVPPRGRERDAVFTPASQCESRPLGLPLWASLFAFNRAQCTTLWSTWTSGHVCLSESSHHLVHPPGSLAITVINIIIISLLVLSACACSSEVTVTSYQTPRLCRFAVFQLCSGCASAESCVVRIHASMCSH